MTSLQVASVTLVLVSLVTGLTDLTRLPGTSGDAVVKATISLIHESCIFKNDYLFLGRLAYVTSRYGTAPSTSKPYFGGGIWQISQSDFNKTLYTASYNLDKIKNAFNITWAKTEWRDLSKPLYSGIAAMLTLNGTSIPKDIQEQGQFYQTYLSGNASVYRTLVSDLDIDCETDNLDMAFVLDSSGSISARDFEKSKSFTATVIGGFSIGADTVRVAVTSFSNGVTEHFGFLRHTSTKSAKDAVLNIPKISGGTYTALALDNLRTSVFTSRGGTRKDSAKIAIIQTDGKSNNKVSTITAANKLKEEGINVFAIGIGNGIDTSELEAIASKPYCTHVRILDDFTELQSIVSDIKNAACKTEVVQDINTTNNYTCSGQKTIKVELSADTTILTRPELGKVNIYGSFDITQPNSAFSDFSNVAGDGKPMVIYVADADKPLYLSITTELQGDECNSTYLVHVVDSNSLKKTGASNLCIKDQKLQECSEVDYVKSGNFTKISKNSNNPVLGVCADGPKGYRSHPESRTKYIYCIPEGGAYVVDCPAGFAYLQSQHDCIVPASEENMCQVCTAENWQIGIRKFPIISNSHQYVQCTGVRHCGLQKCNNDMIYVPDDQLCGGSNTLKPLPGIIIISAFSFFYFIYRSHLA